MKDPADQAHEAEELFRGLALAQHRNRALPPEGDGQCADCGEAIAPARLAAVPGALCCAECQTIADKRRKNQYGLR